MVRHLAQISFILDLRDFKVMIWLDVYLPNKALAIRIDDIAKNFRRTINLL